MGRGSSGVGGNFVRFGQIPDSQRSLNYLKLTGDQRADITDMLSDGDRTPYEAALWLKNNTRDWKNVDLDDIFEQGVSVFKADSDGMPKIDNLDQAMSFAARIGQPLYSVKGKVIGTGQDGEPLLTGASGKKANISNVKMQDKIISTLKKNFAEHQGTKDPSENENVIYSFTDWKTGEKSIMYMGIEFKKPKSSKWR